MSAEEELSLLKEAMVRIGRSPDGRVLYLHLQKTLLAVDDLPQGVDASGALREIHGKRLLARQLQKALAPGVKEIDPNVDERPIVLHSAEPVRLLERTQRGAARRVRELPAGGTE
jgi:hypothetical protein